MVERKLFLRQRLRQQFEKWLFILRHRGQVQLNSYVECPRNIVLGEDSKISYGARLFATPSSKIVIGKNTHIGTNTIFYAFTSSDAFAPRKPNKHILVGDNVLIGANSVILQGAVIGDNCVIGAGSIVLEETVIPSNELWAGNPARFKKVLTLGLS